MSSTGILTCFPSDTLFSLSLGADSPCLEKRWTGTLGLPAGRVFTSLIVTHVSIRTSDTSTMPYGFRFNRLQNAPLPCNKCIRSFGVMLSPVISSARADSTSELLRFL